MVLTSLRAFVFFLVLSRPAVPAELVIHHTAIERILAEQVFTQDGRKYVRGDKTTRCNYAYLENPQVAGEPGRISVRARFAGRAAKGIFGRCVGFGDAFDVRISAVPHYAGGSIGLKDVRVESPGRDGIYIRRVRAALSESLAKDFRYNLAFDAKRVLEEKRDKAPYRQELKDFKVSSVSVTNEALVLNVDFVLAVK